MFVVAYLFSVSMSVLEQICEQASSTLHHINREKLVTDTSAMAWLWGIFRGWEPAEPADPQNYSCETHGSLSTTS